MPIARINDVDLYYETAGDSGDWLIFAHGGGDNHIHWWRQVGEFRKRYRCVVYDARWHGQSSQGLLPTPPDAAWKDLVGLMDHLQIDRACLNGHSMGGAAVAGAAIHHPERVKSLVMTCTSLGFQTTATQRWAAQMVQDVPKGFNIEAHLFHPGFEVREPALFYLCAELRRLNPIRPVPRDSSGYLKVYEGIRDTPAQDYSKVKTPTLFVIADNDELQLPWLVEAAAHAVPNARIVRIAGSGHNAHVERTAEYNAALAAFLETPNVR